MGLFKKNKELQFGTSKLWQNHRASSFNKHSREMLFYGEGGSGERSF